MGGGVVRVVVYDGDLGEVVLGGEPVRWWDFDTVVVGLDAVGAAQAEEMTVKTEIAFHEIEESC